MADSEKRKKYRPIARTRAKELHKQLADASATGPGAHQLSLDFKDEETEFVSSLPREDRSLYGEMYAQELNALTLTAATNEAAARLEEQKAIEMNAHTARKSVVWLWAVLAFLAFLFWLILRA